MIVDVEGFGDAARTNLHQLAVRAGLYRALADAFTGSGIVWADCVSEDRGDGALILVPPDVPKIRLAADLPSRLGAAILRHNTGCVAQERMRLRMALHAGEIYRDAYGVSGAAINHAFRLADAPALKSALGASPGVLAIIVSDWFFGEVVRHDPAAAPDLYRKVQVTVKETVAAGWIRVPELGLTRTMVGHGDDALPSATALFKFRSNTWRASGSLVSDSDPRDLLGSDLGAADSSVSGGSRRPIPAQLPHDISAFTGREPELAELVSNAMGAGGAAVVISAIDGPGGIGKTALAIHFSHRVAAAFPDGQLYVNLRGFDPDQPPLAPRDVLARFLRALGSEPSQMPADPEELAATYRSVLAGRRMLIVLDNAASAGQVRPLLPGTAGCLALVTSRSRLSGLVARDGAYRLTLDVLPQAEATALLASVAGEERVTAEPAAADKLAQLCGRLPLAMRIAADRVAAHRHLMLADLVDELTLERDRLDILSVDEEASAQVRAVFSWSYRALQPEPARVFRLLGLHPGAHISTPAAAALIGATIPRTRQLLVLLSGGHLLEEAGRDRYQFHDLVRVYAAECAQADESASDRAAAVHRLLTWYLHTADAFFRTYNPDAWHVPLAPPESACIPLAFASHRQAAHWARVELVNLISVLRQAAAAGDDVLTWKLAVTLTPVFAICRRIDDLLPFLDSALKAARRLGDRHAEAVTLACLAEARCHVGDPAQAAEFCQRALAISAETGDSYGQWWAWYMEGISFMELERFSEAVGCFQLALAAARQASEPRQAMASRALGMSLTSLGAAYRHLGCIDTAIELHLEALAILKPTHSRWQHAQIAHNLADAYYSQEQFSDAVDYYRQAQGVLQEMGDRWSEATILVDLGQAQRAAGQADSAHQSWHLAMAMLQDFSDTRSAQLQATLKDLSEEMPYK